MLLEAVCKAAGSDLETVWPYLPPTERQWLQEDEDAQEWQVFHDWVKKYSPNFDGFGICADDKPPRIECPTCKHALSDFLWVCNKNHGKPIPDKVLGVGCKFWEQ